MFSFANIMFGLFQVFSSWVSSTGQQAYRLYVDSLCGSKSLLSLSSICTTSQWIFLRVEHC